MWAKEGYRREHRRCQGELRRRKPNRIESMQLRLRDHCRDGISECAERDHKDAPKGQAMFSCHGLSGPRLPPAEKPICAAEQARLSVQKDGRIVGSLMVSAAESLLTYRMPELLQTFQATYPDVQLTLHADVSCATMAAQEPGVDLALSIDEPIKAPQLLVETPQRANAGACRGRASIGEATENHGC
jgi:hypothetical protein